MNGQIEHLYKQLPAPTTTHPEPATTLTNSQLALSLYYMLQAKGQNLRGAIDLADIARYMHVLTGKKYTNLYNSGLYKRLKMVPELKGIQASLKDLQLLHDLFVQVALSEVAQLIQSAIDGIMDRHKVDEAAS